MLYLKQSTAVDLKVGPFLDDLDFNTPEAALTIIASDVRLAKNDGAWAAKNEATALTTEDSRGWYECKLNSTDTNTLGILSIAIHVAGALQVTRQYMVVPDEVYDAMVSGSGAGVRADLSAINGNVNCAAKMEASSLGIITGTVDSGATTTSIPTTGLSPAHSGGSADQFKGLPLMFRSDTATVALRGQKTSITASSVAGVLTVTALTVAPSAGDIFAIL